MEQKKVALKIMTPHEVKVEQMADMVIFRTIDGDMGVLPDHEPTMAVLDHGILRIKEGEMEQKIAVFGGIAKVEKNKVSILTDSAERAEDIDHWKAKKDLEKVEMLLKEKADDLKIQGYQLMLRRTLVRIEISSDSIMNEQDEE